MKVQENKTFYAGSENTLLGFQVLQKAKNGLDESGKISDRKSLYSGDTKLNQLLIDGKRQSARERAMKVIGDAWDSDRSIDRDIEQHRENARKMRADLKAEKEAMTEIRNQEEEMRKAYGVAADSQEQKDAEILLKNQEYGMNPSSESLTEEEKERLEEIYKNGLTDYQKALISHHEEIRSHLQNARKLEQQIKGENAVVRGMRQERLKYSPMTEASDTAEAIMDAASDDILSMLVEQGKDHLDEEQKEREEMGEKIEEKKEEQEEILEKRKEREEETEELTEDILDGEKLVQEISSDMEEAQKEVQKMIDQMGLVVEDIKGSIVDKVL